MTAVINNQGWVTSRTDERGSLTDYGYDPLGRLASITYPTGDSVAWASPGYTYFQLTSPELGIPATAWRSRKILGNFQRSVYHDAQLRPILIEEKDTTTGQSFYVRNGYDAEGRKTFESYRSTSSAASAGINSQYDALGRLVSRQTTDGITLETVGYGVGNRRQTTDADGRTTLIQYQAFDEPDYSRPLKISAPENQVTTIARDRFGKITSVTQAGPFESGTLSFSRQYRYDIYQRLCGRFDPESGSTGWGYDAASQMTWELKGQTATSCVTTFIPSPATQFSYDLRGRKTRADYPGTASDVDYGYDAKGNLTSVSNPTALWTYSYNKRNLLESEQVQIDGKTYLLNPTYNAMAQLTSNSYPGLGAIAYAPNAFGQPTRVGNYATSATYHPNGQIASYVLGNGLSYSQGLDNLQRLNLQSTLRGGTAIQRLAYGYTNADDLISIDDQVDNTDDATLSYDNLHRLTGANGLWGSYTYSYDPINNLRSRAGTNPLSYGYDAAKNRLNSISGAANRSYGYDARGQITSDGSRSFVWNAADQIASIPGVATYSYDGNGKRIKTVKASGEVDYSLYSLSGDMFFTDRSSFDKTVVFLKMAGKPLVNVTLDSGSIDNTTYLHPDLLGSPRLATNESSNIAYSEHYSPYGERLNNFNSYIGYTGHVQDFDTGLVYAQARFYDPLIGRFLSIDQASFSDKNPFTFNRYSYANNSPYRYVDPDGNQPTGYSRLAANMYAQSLMQSQNVARARAMAEQATVASYTNYQNRQQYVATLGVGLSIIGLFATSEISVPTYFASLALTGAGAYDKYQNGSAFGAVDYGSIGSSFAAAPKAFFSIVTQIAGLEIKLAASLGVFNVGTSFAGFGNAVTNPDESVKNPTNDPRSGSNGGAAFTSNGDALGVRQFPSRIKDQEETRSPPPQVGE